MARLFLLLDANVTSGYYLPRCLSSLRARKRIELIVNSARSGASDFFLYIPNFCIAETFSVFMKHGFSSRNRHVVNAGGKLDRRFYRSLVEQFQSDIHNGTLINQYELSRYHILGINWVAPIDHYFKIRRRHAEHRPMGTFDHLLVSMGIQLSKVHGPDNVVIVSTDTRLCDVVSKCRGGLKAKVVRRLKLDIAEEVTGRPYSPSLYPRCVNLATATKWQLTEHFGQWPLPVANIGRVYRWLR
jgi:hypothetical protein